ncbi:MAG: MATE family efflux transporter [Ruthenibacterium sp.]
MERAQMDPSARSLLHMSWPIFIELLLQLLVGNMDQIQLSHFNGTAVAAAGNANQVISVLILLFNVICLAGMILITQYRGANDTRSANQIYTLSLAVNLALSLILAAAVFCGSELILTAMQVPIDTLPEARAYLRITALALPFQALMMTFSSFLRAGAHMKSIMLITGLVNVFNILGNAVLINGFGPLPRLGAAGAALSSSLFRAVGFVLMARAFFAATPEARIHPVLLRPFPHHLLRRLLGIGIPSGGENLSYNLSQMSCLVFVNLMGTAVTTARMYSVMFANCIYMLISAVSQAGQILIGYLVGARRLDDADACNWRILKLFGPITVGLSVLIYLFAEPLFGLFSSDPVILALGKQVMFVEIFLEIGRSVNIVMVRNLQAVGDVTFPVAVAIFSQWVIAVGLGWLLGVYFDLGLVGLWIAFAVDENVRGLIFIVRWRSGKWRKKCKI